MDNDKEAKRALGEAKAYKVILSTKQEIRCDADEISRIIGGIKSGSIIRLRQGIVNPSYFVGIVEDTQRTRPFVEKVLETQKYNRQIDEYHYENMEKKSFPHFEKLADIFQGVELKKNPMQEISEQKKLNPGSRSR